MWGFFEKPPHAPKNFYKWVCANSTKIFDNLQTNYRFWSFNPALTYEYDGQYCIFKTTKLAPMEQFSKIYLLQIEAVLLCFRLRIKVANHRFSNCLPTVRKSLCVVLRHNTICAKFGKSCTNSTAIARKLIKAFLVTFFSKKVTNLF